MGKQTWGAVATCALVGMTSMGCDGSGTMPVTCDATGHTVFRGTGYAFDPGGAGSPLSDVRICVFGDPPELCVQTDDVGAYVLDCVPNGDVAIEMTRSGFVPVIWLRTASGVDQSLDFAMLTPDQQGEFYAPVGISFPEPGVGAVAINDTTHRDGIVYSAPGAMGPFYSPDGLVIDPDATGTVGDGIVFFLAPVGELRIEITPPAGSGLRLCGHASRGWRSTGTGLTVPVREGVENSVLTGCI